MKKSSVGCAVCYSMPIFSFVEKSIFIVILLWKIMICYWSHEASSWCPSPGGKLHCLYCHFNYTETSYEARVFHHSVTYILILLAYGHRIFRYFFCPFVVLFVVKKNIGVNEDHDFARVCWRVSLILLMNILTGTVSWGGPLTPCLPNSHDHVIKFIMI